MTLFKTYYGLMTILWSFLFEWVKMGLVLFNLKLWLKCFRKLCKNILNIQQWVSSVIKFGNSNYDIYVKVNNKLYIILRSMLLFRKSMFEFGSQTLLFCEHHRIQFSRMDDFLLWLHDGILFTSGNLYYQYSRCMPLYYLSFRCWACCSGGSLITK